MIDHHRAFIARRRGLRPSEEYREPTDAEWEEFLDHFERRKVELGVCGQAYGTPCQHEHACIRCPMLRPDPTQLGRLCEIIGSQGGCGGYCPSASGWFVLATTSAGCEPGT